MGSKDGYKIVHFLVVVFKPVLVLFLVGLAYLFIFQKFNLGIPCLFRELTGYKCPGCGMTHALSEVWNLNFYGAWSYNALSITVLPVVCIYLLFRYVRECLHKRDGFDIWEYVLLVVLFIVVLAYGYVRNKS